jgi:hypothetical protein
VAERMGLVRAHADLPEDVKARYATDLCESEECEWSEYSLVKKIEGSFPGRAYGHVLDIPNFGKVHLAVVRIEHSDPEGGKDVYKQTLIDLTMIEVHMGCIASGKLMLASGKNNGGTVPPGGG